KSQTVALCFVPDTITSRAVHLLTLDTGHPRDDGISIQPNIHRTGEIMIPRSADCAERAMRAEEASEIAGDEGTRESLQKIAASWRRLAATYQFVEGIEAKHPIDQG